MTETLAHPGTEGALKAGGLALASPESTPEDSHQNGEGSALLGSQQAQQSPHTLLDPAHQGPLRTVPLTENAPHSAREGAQRQTPWAASSEM